MRYLFIKDHRSEFSVKKMCQVLNVGRSTFYEWLHRLPTKREQEDLLLKEEIKKAFLDSRNTYGHRRIKKSLKKLGICSSNDRIRRLMKELNLVPVQTRKFKATTNSKHSLPVAPNLLKKNFKADAPGQKWVGDISYLSTQEGWLYLATVIDLFSRKVVGWSLGTRMTKQLVIDAMNQALQHERPSKGLIFHSDRGSQYASYDYQDLLCAHGIRQSMSAKGDCYDNACAESFFATLKKECIRRKRFKTRCQAKLAAIDHIIWYNSRRIHSYLDDMSPLEFERQYYQNLWSSVA
jgi:putative transposase